MFNPIKFAGKINLLLRRNKNVILVGPQDSGKTWFVQHTLMPYLYEKGVRVKYYKNCDKINTKNNSCYDFAIVDEVELLLDCDFLQELHPNDHPYYTPDYLSKVIDWQKKLATLNTTGLFIVSREKEAISNILKHVHSLEWNDASCSVIEFNRNIKKNITL